MNTFDRLVESFKGMGLNQQAAELAAKGRGYSTVGQAREAYRRHDAIAEAERRATQATGAAAPAAPAPTLSAATALAESAAVTALGMRPDEAHRFALELREREQRRQGTDDRTARWLQTFADGLKVPLREVAGR